MATKKKLQINPKGSLQDALQQLINQYNSTPTYTAKTNAQLKKQAQNEYGSYYDQLRLGATQAQERSALALQQQRDALNDTYDQQRSASAEAYAKAVSEADRHDLARGMQRSTYNSQVTANLRQKGNEALQGIWDQQAKAEGNIDAQQAQLAQQLAEQLRQYDASEAADVLKRMQQLEDQEYERGMTAAQYQNSLAGQIYNYMQQAQSADKEDERWQKQFDYQMQRDAVSDKRYDDQQAYQRERDAVSDARYQQQFDYQASRDKVSDQRYAEERAYQRERDTVADQRYDDQQAYQRERDKVADTRYADETAYNRSRDAVADARYADERDYQRLRNDISDKRYTEELNYNRNYQAQRDAVADQRWATENQQDQDWKQRSFDYQAQRDNVSDEQWRQQFERQTGLDAQSADQWERQFAESIRQFNVQHPETPTTTGGGYVGGGTTSSKKSSYSSSTSKTTTNTTQQTGNAGLNALITGLSPTSTAASTQRTSAASTQRTSAATPTPKVINGPVDQKVMAAANAYAPQTGTYFISSLAAAQNAKNTTTAPKTTTPAKTTTTNSNFFSKAQSALANALDKKLKIAK